MHLIKSFSYSSKFDIFSVIQDIFPSWFIVQGGIQKEDPAASFLLSFYLFYWGGDIFYKNQLQN